MSTLMPIEHRNAALAGAWILTAGFIGVLSNVTSPGAGALILAFGLLPPLILVLRASPKATVLVHNRRGPVV